MKKTETCPKCGSKEIAADLVMPDRFDCGYKTPQKIDVATTPQNMIFKGIRQFEVRVCVCQDCGFIEQYLKRPQSFAKALRESKSNSQ